MKLLDSYQTQLSFDYSDQRLLTTLQDITNKVEIDSNFCIRHPDYKPLQLPPEIVARFELLPLQIQNSLLNSQLCNYLYSLYYNGAITKFLALNSDSENSTPLKNLENNTYLGVDLAFYERLHSYNHGQGYFDSGWQVLREEEDGTFAVKKGDLTLNIGAHHLPTNKYATVGNLIAIRMPRNLVQNGFYMAVGNLGQAKHTDNNQLVRVYFNVTPEGAVAVMDKLTRQLNAMSIPFSFKALYNPSDYARYDTAVLYFEKNDYKFVWQVLQSVYQQCRLHFRDHVPLFTKMLAPGLAIAEEPNRKFSSLESFGLNRCQLVANAMLEARQQGDESAYNRMILIIKHFAQQGIELQRPYLNYGSSDIYLELD
jgi:hypothetical protein